MSLFREKKNCWKVSNLERGGFLIDAAAYYRNLYEAMLQAEDSIFILGWDIDTRTKLIPHPTDPEIPTEFAPLLSYLVKKKKNLHIYILIWDYYSILAFERELFVRLKLGWMNAKRIQFHLDGEFPMGASHHQKVVVVDDRVAFCGGIDISSERWDTPSHRRKNRLRKDHNGSDYEPQHDLQMMVEGEASAWLGVLARNRWQRATGKKIPVSVREEAPDRFDALEWNIGPGTVAISRTEPSFKNHRAVREVEQLFLDLIAQTKHHLYIENQYLTSETVFDALKKSLSKKNGPEITIVIPKESAYWVENYTMGTLQAFSVKNLYDSDPHHRLGIFSPMLGNERIKVHSKVMICDDAYARIGSSNLSNRSMGLDTECDLTLDGSRNKSVSAAILDFKAKLLAEHLSSKKETIRKMLTQKKRVNAYIRQHPGKERSLREITPEILPQNILTKTELADLTGPLEIDLTLDTLARDKAKLLRNIPCLVGTFLGLVLLFFVLWKSLPFLHTSVMRDFFLKFEDQSVQPLWIACIYGVAGLFFIPINLLILATASIYGGLQAFLYATFGSLLNASVSYAVGNLLGKRSLQKIFYERVQRIAKKLEKKGVSSIAVIRLIPIAPYSMVNFIAGAFHIRFRDFLIGTLLGMLPGIILLITFQRSLMDMLLIPNAQNVIMFTIIAAAIGLGLYELRKRLNPRK